MRPAALSRYLRANPLLKELPAYMTSPEAIETMVAGAQQTTGFLRIAEVNRQKHRDSQHGGFSGGEACEECGFYEAAVYDAQTGGRSLTHDLFGTGRPRIRS